MTTLQQLIEENIQHALNAKFAEMTNEEFFAYVGKEYAVDPSLNEVKDCIARIVSARKGDSR